MKSGYPANAAAVFENSCAVTGLKLIARFMMRLAVWQKETITTGLVPYKSVMYSLEGTSNFLHLVILSGNAR
jgi:hypothetical protein